MSGKSRKGHSRRHNDVSELVLKMMKEEKKAVWNKPWITQGGYVKHSDLTEYSRFNSILLMLQGVKPGSEMIGYNAARKEGGFVKEGESGKFIYKKGLCKSKTKVDKDGNPEWVSFVKTLYVFDVETQCVNIKKKRPVKEFVHDRFDEADKVFKEYCERCNIAFVEDASGGAFFSPGRKLIQVPPLKCFENVAEYYSALFHEAVHSTGIKVLLNRHDENTKLTTFGSEDYSKEELVAEMGGLFCLYEFGIEDKCQFRNSVAYFEGWYEKIKSDPDIFEWAVLKAEDAVDLIFNRVKEYENDEENN